MSAHLPPDERDAKASAWAEVRRALEAAGFRPSKRLGQNFLLDANLARAIARDAQLSPDEFVLEIGPGTGALTGPLLDLGARVLAVEIDARLLEIARSKLAGRGAIEWLHVDALAGKHELAPELVARLPREGPWSLVSNLPYSSGTPILALLARAANPPRAMTALLQRELVDRIVAAPGGAEWGPLSVRLQLAYDGSIVRTVAPQLFWPRPEVESAVLRLVRKSSAPAAEDWSALDRLLDAWFQHRRQSISRLAAAAVGDRHKARDWLARHGVDAANRPQSLAAETILALSRDPTWREAGETGRRRRG